MIDSHWNSVSSAQMQHFTMFWVFVLVNWVT